MINIIRKDRVGLEMGVWPTRQASCIKTELECKGGLKTRRLAIQLSFVIQDRANLFVLVDMAQRDGGEVEILLWSLSPSQYGRRRTMDGNVTKIRAVFAALKSDWLPFYHLAISLHSSTQELRQLLLSQWKGLAVYPESD